MPAAFAKAHPGYAARTLRPVRWFALLMLLGGCLPEEAPVIGKACDDAHPCGGELVCNTEGLCAESAASADGGITVENLLVNGGFDATPDGLVGWRPGSESELALSEQVFRTSEPSMVVSVLDGGAYAAAALEKSVVPSPAASGNSGAVYCADAWVKRKDGTDSIAIALRAHDTAGAFVDSQGDIPGSKIVPVTDAWHRIETRLVAAPPHDAAVNVRLFSGAPSFYVDDVRMWIGAADGGCQ